MEFVKGHIYGFGKLQKVSLEFGKGFQIIWVKDENEKNTLLQFLLDMLFGQKTSQRKNALFSENYYKYIPWQTQDYRGNIICRLNTGKIIHLHRVFGPETLLRIYEGLDVKDITDTIPLYPCGEPAFIQNYLDINRELFSEIAIISPKTIENVRDSANYRYIEKHLVSLIDTGTTKLSVQDIITSFQEYLQAIGTERTYKRPRNFIREQLEKLTDEYEQAKVNLAKILQEKICLKEHKKRLKILQTEYNELLKKLEYAQQYALWRRKNDAKALREKLDELTARSFAYSNYRNFPVEYHSHILQSEMAISQAENQKQKLQVEIEQVTKKINELEYELHHSPFIPIDYIRDYQERFEEFQKHIHSNKEVLGELYGQQEKVKEQIREVEEIISEFPEVVRKDDMFYQKVEFAIDLYKSSMKETQKSEDQLRILKEEYAYVEEQIKPYKELFSDIADFGKMVDDYLKYKDKPEEEQQELEKQLQEIEDIKQSTKSRQPVELVLGFLCLLLGSLLIYIYIFLEKKESLWFALAVGAGFIYFLSSYLNGRRNLKEIQDLQIQLQEKIKRIVSLEYIDKHPITALLNKANLQHVRELQGLYEEYCIWLNRKEKLSQQVQDAEELFFVNQSRTNDLYLEMQKLFEQIGLSLEDEQKIEYNRRKAYEFQEKIRMYNRRLWDLQEQNLQLSETISRKEDYIKKIQLQIQEEILHRIGKEMIHSGILQPEEALTQDTFRKYYQAEEAYQGLKVNIIELRKKRLDLHQQLQKLDEEIAQHQKRISEILALAGVNTLSEWKNKYARAEEAYSLFSRIEQTKLQLQQILNDDSLEELEQLTKEFVPFSPPEDEEKLQSLIEQKKYDIEQLQNNIQGLEIELAELIGKYRPLNEIEEEKNYYETLWRIIQKEQESILLAISMLQQLSTYRYHKIAPYLQNEMNRLITKLTNGRYNVTFAEQDLTIKIISTDTGKIMSLEDESLSPGVLEQLYFTLRIAIMKIPHYLKESLPLLLDDPFIQYDYPQLIQSLDTLKILGEEQQIILFTCINDIPDIGKDMDIPVVTIEEMG